MSESILLSDMLKKRYVTDFVQKMADLGCDREYVLQRAANLIEQIVCDESTSDDTLKDFNKTCSFKEYVEYHLGDTLDAVFGGKDNE